MFSNFLSAWWDYWGLFVINYIKPYRDEILAVATIFLAIFTMILSYVAYRQNKITRIVERAYVSVSPFGIETFRTKNNVIALIAIKNSGRLPARKISWVIYRDWSDQRRRRNFPIRRTDFVCNNIIASGGEIIKGTGPIPIKDFSDIAAKSPQIYVWGEIRYRSGFGLRRRMIRFCHRYDVTGIVPDDTGVYRIPARDGRHHEYGNEAN
jgi:hypothetical protein